MKYLLLWSNKDGNYWYETDNIKNLTSPLEQIYDLHKSKTNKTSLPRVFKGLPQVVNPIYKKVKGKDVLTKFNISDPKNV